MGFGLAPSRPRFVVFALKSGCFVEVCSLLRAVVGRGCPFLLGRVLVDETWQGRG